MIAHSIILITKRNAKLKVANEAATRYKLYKRKRVQREGSLTFVERERLTTLKEFEARGNREKAKKRRVTEGGELAQRHCGTCGETGHNARTCKKDALSNVE
jgi:hypothetical protein